MILKAAQKVLKNNLTSDYEFFLFGSWAQGNALPASDLDIGIMGPKAVPFKTLVRIQEEIETIPTLRKIDVVDFHSADPSFKKAALKYRKPL